MIIRQLTLQDFRNVARAELAFSGLRQYFVGANGQGKSNLLEAAAFLTALRSFRAPDSRQLIMHGRTEAGVAAEVEVVGGIQERVVVRVRRDGKELWRDGARIGRLADHVGRLPTVVFSSHDLQLLRGAPALRRRWLDLALASLDADYLAALQTYARALAGRNALLRRAEAASAAELSSFERILAPAGARIVELRALRVAELDRGLSDAYMRVSGGSETASMRYDSELAGAGADEMLRRMEAGRQADIRLRSTLVGPHRDDLRFEVSGVSARDFASEGQQRSVVLGLKLAQAAWSHVKSGSRPVLLADDVLGELDPGRRQRFWSAVDPECQVIATGTERPAGGLGDWQVFSVAGGGFGPEDGLMGGPA